ncbi:hypothetical protein B0H13DRAFT_2436841 [Mycena leptocephala]|nr:hypothetical protein B0H13DRAFT_2436841 [Mycena leptocephala]
MTGLVSIQNSGNGTCYHPEEHADDSNAIFKFLMTISLTAPRPDAPAPAELPTHERAALSTLCGPPPFGGEEDLELSAAYPHALLAAIKRALAGKVDDVAGYADSLVPVLYGLCAEATTSERNLLVTLDVTQTSTPASVRRRSSSGPRAGQRVPVFRIVPVGSVVNVNKHVDELAPFLELEHEKTAYWSDQTALTERRR